VGLRWDQKKMSVAAHSFVGAKWADLSLGSPRFLSLSSLSDFNCFFENKCQINQISNYFLLPSTKKTKRIKIIAGSLFFKVAIKLLDFSFILMYLCHSVMPKHEISNSRFVLTTVHLPLTENISEGSAAYKPKRVQNNSS